MRFLIGLCTALVLSLAAHAGDSNNSRLQLEIVSMAIYEGLDVDPVWSKAVDYIQNPRVSYVKKKAGIVCTASIDKDGGTANHTCMLPGMFIGYGNIQFEGEAAEIVYNRFKQAYESRAQADRSYIETSLGALGKGRIEYRSSIITLSTDQGQSPTERQLLECVDPSGSLPRQSGGEFEEAYKAGVLPGPKGSYRCVIHLRSF